MQKYSLEKIIGWPECNVFSASLVISQVERLKIGKIIWLKKRCLFLPIFAYFHLFLPILAYFRLF
jgi:hypothetical protein